MKPPISYYGGKIRLAKRISDLLPPTEVYVEAFAGSAAVLLARAPSHWEVLNDTDKEVHNFWKVLRDNRSELVELLESTPYGREEYFESLIVSGGDTPLERARKFFVNANMAFNSSTGKDGYSSGSPRPTAPKPATFVNKVDRLEVIARRLRKVELQNIDALKLIDKWDRPETSLYLDPPYIHDTRISLDNYSEENGGLDFHEKLIERLKSFTGSAVLSGYAHPLYDELGWLRIDIDVLASSSGGSGKQRTECLWVNL